jgi:hypothetical protein
MLRIATLAAVSALLAAGPVSAETIHISTVGKSPAQLMKEIRHAADHVCLAEAGVSSPYLKQPCAEATVKAAVARSGDPDLQVALR